MELYAIFPWFSLMYAIEFIVALELVVLSCVCEFINYTLSSDRNVGASKANYFCCLGTRRFWLEVMD
jgi:hypothetical protein